MNSEDTQPLDQQISTKAHNLKNSEYVNFLEVQNNYRNLFTTDAIKLNVNYGFFQSHITYMVQF